MSATPHETRLAELLDELGLSQAELVRRSHASITTAARVVHGERASAAVRTRIVAAINMRRAELQQPKLAASAIFPVGWFLSDADAPAGRSSYGLMGCNEAGLALFLSA